MTGDNATPSDQTLRDVASLLLSVIADDGFVLAGAIREHSLTQRRTADVDLFGPPLTTPQQFATVVERVEHALLSAGYTVERARSFAQFARLGVAMHDRQVLDVDLALNFRADPPVQMAVGPVLSERDAFAGKLSAVYSRGEVRDFLDLDAIRSSGRWPDETLLALAREHDEGFDARMFAAQLARVGSLLPSEAATYGISDDDFAAVQSRLLDWASTIIEPPTPVP